jgi:DNA-binding response OmpR family regulator
MRIYVVDDVSSLSEMLVRICSRDGHDVTGTSSSREAIDYLTKNSVDLLVVDIVMPPPDGLQVIREARAAQPNLMSIAMTGHLGQYTLQDVQAVGATDLIYKPVRVDEFRARIAFAEQRRRVIDGFNVRRRELQQMSADMLKALQDELDETRKSVRAGRMGNGKQPAEGTEPVPAPVPGKDLKPA